MKGDEVGPIPEAPLGDHRLYPRSADAGPPLFAPEDRCVPDWTSVWGIALTVGGFELIVCAILAIMGLPVLPLAAVAVGGLMVVFGLSLVGESNKADGAKQAD